MGQNIRKNIRKNSDSPNSLRILKVHAEGVNFSLKVNLFYLIMCGEESAAGRTGGEKIHLR